MLETALEIDPETLSTVRNLNYKNLNFINFPSILFYILHEVRNTRKKTCWVPKDKHLNEERRRLHTSHPLNPSTLTFKL